MVKGIGCGTWTVTGVRFAPPLIITKDEIDWALDKIEPVLIA